MARLFFIILYINLRAIGNKQLVSDGRSLIKITYFLSITTIFNKRKDTLNIKIVVITLYNLYLPKTYL